MEVTKMLVLAVCCVTLLAGTAYGQDDFQRCYIECTNPRDCGDEDFCADCCDTYDFLQLALQRYVPCDFSLLARYHS